MEQQLALYKKLLDEVGVGIHVIDESGKSIIYNAKMMEIESMASEDVLGKNITDVFKFSRNQSSTLLEALKTGKTSRHIKQTYFNNRGKEITTINNTFPFIFKGQIKGAIEIAEDVTQLERVIKEHVLRKQHSKFTFDQIIGENHGFKIVIEEAKRASRTGSSVLIIGETGTGKELFAQSIHNGSPRAQRPFISQNCAAIPDNLMESLLFGTKKGAFTGAIDRPGLFEQANGGTLLLDEINSLNPSLQAKLLRAIQDKMIRRVGDTKDKEVDVRIMATLNEDPIEAIAENRLRKDLYYRLSVVTLFIPPLRERKEDIWPLAKSFIEKYNALFQMAIQGMTREVQQLLEDHDWPGNVRELEHTIEGMMNLLVGEEVLSVEHLPVRFRYLAKTTEKVAAKTPIPREVLLHLDEHLSLQERLDVTEKDYILEILARSKNNITQASKKLGLSRQSLQYRMRKLGLK